MVLHMEQTYTDSVMIFGRQERDMNMEILGFLNILGNVKELHLLSQNTID